MFCDHHSLLCLFYSLHKYRLGFLSVNTDWLKMLKMEMLGNTAGFEFFSSKLPLVECKAFCESLPIQVLSINKTNPLINISK